MLEHMGEIARFHRKKSGLTQQGLASLAGVGKNIIYELEKGHGTIRLANLLKILKVLNIELELRSPLMDTFHREHNEKS